MDVRLSEIFTSIEGEGILYGTKTLFVRLAGCPFGCFYCDTPDSLPMDSGNLHTVDEACELIKTSLEPNTYKVNFTGGEPLMQADALAEMARFVRSMGMPTYIESSCHDSAKFSQVVPFIDIVKVELKTHDSEFVDEEHYPDLLQNALECLRISVNQKKRTYVKIVVSSRTSEAHFAELVKKVFQTVPAESISGLIIQPTHGTAEPGLDLLLKLYDVASPLYGEVRVVPQLHKIIGAP